MQWLISSISVKSSSWRRGCFDHQPRVPMKSVISFLPRTEIIPAIRATASRASRKSTNGSLPKASSRSRQAFSPDAVAAPSSISAYCADLRRTMRAGRIYLTAPPRLPVGSSSRANGLPRICGRAPITSTYRPRAHALQPPAIRRLDDGVGVSGECSHGVLTAAVLRSGDPAALPLKP